MQRTFSEIDLSHLIVIDLTEKGVGLGIEAGYAYAKGIPIAVIAKKGPIFPQHYRAFRSNYFYNDEFGDLTHFFKDTTFLGQSNEGFVACIEVAGEMTEVFKNAILPDTVEHI